METWDAITSRRNVRQYTGRSLPRSDLERVLEAGRRAPSSSNWQPWHFVAVSERARLRELSEVWRGAGHVADSATTIALVAEIQADDRRARSLQYDFGQATAYMMLAAADLGIGSGHASVEDQEQARRVLGFPGDHFCAYLIALGFPADRPLRPIRQPKRRPFDEVVHWERW